jgi:hypothetical protein
VIENTLALVATRSTVDEITGVWHKAGSEVPT